MGNLFVEAVREFHEAFAIPVRCQPTVAVPDDEVALRIALIEEEATEAISAIEERDLVGLAGELADLVYVTVGTALTFGVPLEEVFAEVHAANMHKLGADGHPVRRSDGKVVKPEGWRPADVASIIAARSREPERRRPDDPGLTPAQLRHIADLLDAGEAAFRALERLTGKPALLTGSAEVQDTLRAMANRIDEHAPLEELHEERTDKPNWDTMQRCTCGFESVSRAEQWRHAADALRAVVAGRLR